MKAHYRRVLGVAIVVGGVLSGAALRAAPVAPAPPKAEARLLTLGQALSKAYAANPSITTAKETVEAARHRVDGSWTGYLPQAIAAVSYRRATANSAVPPWVKLPPEAAGFSSMVGREEASSYDNFAASLTVTQTLWDFGRTAGTHAAAKAQREAAAADLSTTVDGVWLRVVQAYYGVLAGQEVVEAAEETKRLMEKHLEQARVQWEAGTRQRIDVTRAQSDLATADLSLLRAQNGLLLSRVNLDAAMGGEGDTSFRVETPPEPIVLELDAAQAVRQALACRSEYRSLKEKVRAAQSLVRVARSAWYPSLAASGSLAWSGYQVDDLPYNWSLGATASWNALSGFAASASTEEARSNLLALRASLKSLEVAIRSEVQSALLTYREAIKRVELATTLQESAQQTLQLAEGRYAAGLGSMVEVTDSQNVWVLAQTELIRGRFDVQVARAQLMRATGEIASAGPDKGSTVGKK